MHRKHLYAILAPSLCLCSSALANPITITSTAVGSTILAPSGDTYSFNSGNVTSSAPGDIVFQTGTFTRGILPTAAQVISFSFADTITLNGVTKTITISGQDSITSTSDVLTILAGSLVYFGNDSFKVDSATFTSTAVGQAVPLSLSASISPVAEPTSLALSGIGLSASSLLAANVRRRAIAARIPSPIDKVPDPS